MIENKHSEELYMNIGIDQLVIYSIYKILNSGEECTFERIVYEAFNLFPEKFRFQRYPEWPDAVRINKSWLRCRTDKGWIIGTVKEGFRLTEAGAMVAKNICKQLKTGLVEKKAEPRKKTRERYQAIIAYIKNSNEYKNYVNEHDSFLSDDDLRSFLGGTLETPKRILRSNLNLYLKAAEIYKEESVIPFLNKCKKQLLEIGR